MITKEPANHNIILYENMWRCEVVVLPDDMKNDA